MKKVKLLVNQKGQTSLQWVFLGVAVVAILGAVIFFMQSSSEKAKNVQLTADNLAVTTERDAAKAKVSKTVKYTEVNRAFWDIYTATSEASFNAKMSTLTEKVDATGDSKLKSQWKTIVDSGFQDSATLLEFMTYLSEVMVTSLS